MIQLANTLTATLPRAARRAFLAFAMAGAFVTPAAAQMETIQGVLSIIGLTPPEREAIEYRERPPLVVPREMKLRQPESEKAAAERNAAWPNDPDVARRAREAEEARRPFISLGGRNMAGTDRLTPDEIAAGRAPRSREPVAPRETYGDNSRDEFWVRPDILQAEGRARTEPVTPIGVEPPRRALTDPPVGLRRPTNAADVRRARDTREIEEDVADPRVYQRQQAARE